MNSARVCLYVSVLMMYFGHVTSFIISESRDTTNLFKGEYIKLYLHKIRLFITVMTLILLILFLRLLSKK